MSPFECPIGAGVGAEDGLEWKGRRLPWFVSGKGNTNTGPNTYKDGVWTLYLGGNGSERVPPLFAPTHLQEQDGSCAPVSLFLYLGKSRASWTWEMMTVMEVVMVLAKAVMVGMLVLVGRVAVWAVQMFFWAPLMDPLRKMSGPEGSLFQSHLGAVMNPDTTAEKTSEFVHEYGRTFRFHGFGRYDYRIISYDFRVVSHVLNSSTYEKPWQTRSLLSKWFGGGLFSAEGSEHRWQRKLIGPAFSAPAVRSMTPIFFQKADELKTRWNSLISRNADDDGVSTEEEDSGDILDSSSSTHAVINVAHWVSRAMLDVVGLAGFGYHFHSLRGESEELYLAYRRMFDVIERGMDLRGLLQLFVPLLERFWPDKNSREISECQRVIRKTGKGLVDDKKAMILAEKSSASDISDRDILSLLIKSNLSADSSKRLSDSALLGQLSNFLFAGADSTALAISYCLHFLALHPEIQTRLREELASGPSSRDTSSPEPDDGRQSPPSRAYNAARRADSLDELPYLDSVVRETLRLCPPVHSTIRVPTKDDLIPVSHPVKMRDGTVVPAGGCIPIRKGTYVHIPIAGLNVCEDIWGKDAKEFNPDRWSSLPPTARPPVNPGLANVMTFLSGPRSCIGTRFSIAEIKVFVATLVQHFVFEPSEPIAKFSAVLTRPYVAGKFSRGSTLPLKVRRYVE